MFALNSFKNLNFILEFLFAIFMYAFIYCLKNADVVTLLRLHQLNDEIGSTEDQEPGGDATYNEVMRDFSHLANNQRLKKRDGGSSSSSSIANSNVDNISVE